MKLNGILGKGSGKLGSSVFAISGGIQIMREYNPNVSNPNTDAQINQRAKLKLMSQIAADLASVIVIPKSGLVSARNRFISKNIGLVEAVDGEATVNYVALQLTASDSAFPAVTGSIDKKGKLSVELAKMPAADVQKVVYCAFAKDDTNQLSLIGTTIIDRNDATNNFAATFANAGDAYVVYAYGIKTNTIAANSNYDNYDIQGATDIARLVASRSITLDASGTTRTSGVLVAAGAITVTSISINGKDVEQGSIAGPFDIAKGDGMSVNFSESMQGKTAGKARVRALVGSEEKTIDFDFDAIEDKEITWSCTNLEAVTGAYALSLDFTIDKQTYGISFTRP